MWDSEHQYFTSHSSIIHHLPANSTFQGVSPSLWPAPGLSIFYGWEMKLLPRHIISAQDAHTKKLILPLGNYKSTWQAISSGDSSSPCKPQNLNTTWQERACTCTDVLPQREIGAAFQVSSAPSLNYSYCSSTRTSSSFQPQAPAKG